MNTPHTQPRSERLSAPRAFTLLELQIALLLMILLFTTLFSVLRLIRNSWSTSEQRGAALDERHSAAELLRSLLLKAVPVTITANGQTPRLLFHGDADCLQFVAPLPAHRGDIGLYYLSLGWAGSDEEWGLRLHYLPLNTETMEKAKQDTAGTTLTLMEKVTGDFAYQKPRTSPPLWGPRWKADAVALPYLLRVRLRQHDGSSHPDWIMPIYRRSPAGAPLVVSQERLRELGAAPDCARLGTPYTAK